MKKVRIFSVLLLLVTVVLFAGFQVYRKVVTDRVPPEIHCESDVLKISVKGDTSKLLEDVTAYDQRDGDVSGQLIVEKISGFIDEDTRTVTYAAVDSQMNVGRKERTIVYTDYEEPRFRLNGPLCFPAGSSVNVFSCISADSVLDGELDGRIKYSLDSMINSSEAGEYPIEFRVLDSAGKQVYLKTSVEIYAREYDSLKVTLSDYLVYLKQGESFDAASYFEEVTQGTGVSGMKPVELAEGELRIESDVDTSVKGVYCVDYYAEHEMRLGKSRLIVVVE
ncbi:MAG: hypothetical protein ACI4DV_02170 [Lachnospiraceae bacterium]